MGVLRVSKELCGTRTLKVALSFLRKEHEAIISEPVKYFFYDEYVIEGKDIPRGRQEFTITIKEIVPKVLSITVE
jgi:hypothetical protein